MESQNDTKLVSFVKMTEFPPTTRDPSDIIFEYKIFRTNKKICYGAEYKYLK